MQDEKGENLTVSQLMQKALSTLNQLQVGAQYLIEYSGQLYYIHRFVCSIARRYIELVPIGAILYKDGSNDAMYLMDVFVTIKDDETLGSIARQIVSKLPVKLDCVVCSTGHSSNVTSSMLNFVLPESEDSENAIENTS
jgi:hypothetical protein